MATTTVEDSPSKMALSSSRKKPSKSVCGSSMKGALSNSLFGGGNSNSNSIGRMDASDLPPYSQQNDHSTTSVSDEKMGHFVSGIKNHLNTATSSTTSSPGLDLSNSTATNASSKPSKRKSGSESSNGGGGQSSMANSVPHSDGASSGGSRRGLPGSRGFSSGSSDGEEEQVKHGTARKTRAVKPSKPVTAATASSDDEATDSADEGSSGGEEDKSARRRAREGGDISTTVGTTSLPPRQSDRLMNRKDSSESTNSATSPVLSTAHATSTIFVESALPKEPLIGVNSPVNMAVGYGAAAAESMPPPSAVFDKTPTQSPPSTPTMDSPKLASDGPHSPGTPLPLSPPSAEPSEGPSSSVATQPSSGMTVQPPGAVPLNPIQPSPSLQGPSFNLPFENWVYQAQAAAVYSPFPLTSSHPGSVATTPVPVESGPYLRTGAPVFLRGTVCQESEGVLIVSVQWRNKTFSGSLIDMNHHEWAPPRLAGGFDEPLAHLRDLCKQQEKRESESQQVNVDVEGDDSAKDTTSASEKMDSSTKEEDMSGASVVAVKGERTDEKSDVNGRVEETEASLGRPKLPRNQSMESEPGDMEIVEEPTSSNSRSQNQSPTAGRLSPPHLKPRGGAAKVSVDSVYSDISDVSDSEEKGRKDSGSGQGRQVAPFVASSPPPSQASRGSRPKKIAAEEIQHTLPSFSAINTSSSASSQELAGEVKHEGRRKPRSGGEKEPPSDSSSAAFLLRSNLLSSYPSTPTTGTTTVSTPNQNHRHSFAGTPHPVAVSGGPLANSAVFHSQPSSMAGLVHTDSAARSSVAKPTTNFSIESLNSHSGSGDAKDVKLAHSRSSSPHPLLLKPREGPRGRSTSPVRSAAATSKGEHPPVLPPFNTGSVVHQDATKTTTLDYMPAEPNHAFSKSNTADDSDSSGSGSILSTHRKKKPGKHKRRATELLTGLKEGKDDSGIKAPETPALGPIGIHNFHLKIQPISPGIDYPAQQQHMPSSLPKDGPAVPVSSTAVSLGSPARSPSARVASPHTTTVGEAMGALLTAGSSSGTFKDAGMAASLSKSARESEKGDKDSSGKDPERRHPGTTSSSPSSVSSTSIPGISLGMPAPNYRLPQGVIQPPSQARMDPSAMAAIKQELKRRSPVPPEMLRQSEHQNQGSSRKRKSNTSPGSTTEPVKDGEEAGNMDSASRSGQHPPAHAFPFAQQPGFSTFASENEKMDLLPPDFNYDPNLPMTMQYQLLSFVNQKKQAQMKEYEDQLKELARKDKEEMERQGRLAQFQQQQQHPRPPKRPRISGDPHLNPGVPPLQLPHPSSPAGASKDHGGKHKKPSHHQHRSHMDHGEERHFGQIHPVNIKSEPLEMLRHGKPPSSGVSKLHPHQGHRVPLPTSSSSSSSSSKHGAQNKPLQPQSRGAKSDKLVIKTEAGADVQPPNIPPPGAMWPTVIPMGMVPPGSYQYSILQQQQQQAAHALQQSKEAAVKQVKEHKDVKETVAGSQHAGFHSQPISAPIVAFSAGSQAWPSATPFIHGTAHPTIIHSGALHADRGGLKQDSQAITTTTSVITGKPAVEMHSPSHHRTHRSVGQSSPSSGSKKSSAFSVGDGGSERHGLHKLHSGHDHTRGPPTSSGSHTTNRRMDGSSSSQRSGGYPDGAESSRRSHSHPHSSSSSVSAASSTTQQSSSGSGHSSSSSRSHKSTAVAVTAADHLASAAQLQVQAAATAHQMSLLQQQQQQTQSLSSPVAGLQLRPGIPLGAGLVQPNWEDWLRLQEMIQKGQVGAMGSAADPWQQMQQMQMLAQHAQGVPLVPLTDPSILIALQQQQQQQHQQQQQQQQNADQATTAAIQNFQLLQAAAASGNMIPMLHPAAMAGTHPAMATAGLYEQTPFGSAAAMLPHFPMAATSQKRE